MLFYWSTRATGPTILVTVGITVRRVTYMLLTVLLSFLKFFHELSHLSHFFSQISHLSGISTARFLPSGLLWGVEGFGRPDLLAAVLVEPATLIGVVCRERPVNSLAPFAILGGTATRASGVAWGSWNFSIFLDLRKLPPIPKRTTVGDCRVLNSKCPKRVGSFGYSTDFLMRKSTRSDIDSIRKLWA